MKPRSWWKDRLLLRFICISLLTLCSFRGEGSDNQGIGYSVTEVPLPQAPRPRINDKGQVVTLDSNGSVLMYLPTADYGRDAGVHDLGSFDIKNLREFNTNGRILWETNDPSKPGAVWNDGDLFTFEAGSIHDLNNQDQILIGRSFDAPVGVYPRGSSSVLTLDGQIIDAVHILPHEGEPGRNSVYSFYDINDHGVLAGTYTDYNGAFAGDDIHHPATWNPSDGPVRRVFPSLGIDGAWHINNKGQILGYRGDPRVSFVYLPRPDYGKPAGFWDLPELLSIGVVPGAWGSDGKFTDHGEIYVQSASRSIWYRGRIINPSHQLTDGNSSNITDLHDINNKGAVLATGALNGQPDKLLIYQPTISAFIVVTPGEIELGETFTMSVTISNDSSEPFVLAGVLGESFQVRGNAVAGLQQIENPAPTDFLAPGESWTQVFPWKATQYGEVKFAFRVAGFHEDGTRFLTAPMESAPVKIAGDLMKVEVEVNPSVVELEEDQNGEPVFEDVLATIRITNLHDGPLENVEIFGFSARPLEEPPPVPVPLAIVDGPFDPAVPESPSSIQLGTLEKDQTLIRTYNLRAQAKGKSEVNALIQADNPFGGDFVRSSGETEIDIKQDLLLVFDTSVENVFFRKSTPFALGGNTWRIFGSLENRSEDETLLVQITPELTGNAFYAQPIPEGTVAPDQECACGILQELEPEEKVSFYAPVRTLDTGGTRGTVLYRPKVWIKADDGTLTLIHDERSAPAGGGPPILDDRIVVTHGSGNHTVSVDVSDEHPKQPFADELIGHFLVGTVDGLGNFAEGIVGMIQLARDVAARLEAPWTWPRKYANACFLLAEYYANTVAGLSGPDRAQFETELRVDLNEALEVSSAVMNQMIGAFNQSVTDLTVAWETGDTVAVTRFWGEFAGENPDLAIGIAYGFCKLGAKSSRYAARGLQGFKASEAATLEARIAAGIRALKPWDELNYAQLAKLFGIDEVSHNLFKEFSAKGFVLAVRRRGSRTIAKLKSGGYVTKPYHMKAKNVNHIDVDWLEFPEGKLDEVVIKQPPTWPEVLERMKNQEPDLIGEVRLRWEKRAEEWWGKGVDDNGLGGNFAKSERKTLLDMQQNGEIAYSQGSVEGLVDNFDEGFAIPQDDLKQVQKKFELEEGPNGELIPKIEGKLVTGDIDPMYVGRADGRGWVDMTDEERLEVYRIFRDLGLEHPESRTWRNSKVNEYFEEFSVHNPDREAMAMYLPDGRVIAAFFDPGKSWFNPQNWKDFYLFFRGGTTMLNSSQPTAEGLAAAFAEEIARADAPRPVYVGPGSWALISPDCPANSGLRAQSAVTEPQPCPCDVTYSNSSDALVLRQTFTNAFEEWTVEEGWHPYTPPSLVMKVKPQTYLASFAATGSTVIEIGALSDLGLNEGANEWFESGQAIVINPGGYNEEYATVTGLGSLALAGPLQFTHEPRETVVALGSADEFFGPTLSIQRNDNEGLFELIWPVTDQEFHLEESSDLVNWEESSLTVHQVEPGWGVSLMPASTNRFFRLRNTNQ